MPKPPVVAARASDHLLQTSVTPGLLQTSVARTFVSRILFIILYSIILYDIVFMLYDMYLYIITYIHIHAQKTGLRAHWGRTIRRLFGAHVAYADVAVWSVAGM